MTGTGSKSRPIEELETSNVIALFFDIDDTFSSDGKITSEAYSSIWRLKEGGKVVAPITGRPAGWCDHIARMWPVDAVVGENGAFYFMMKDGKLQKVYTANPEERIANKKRLMEIKKEILKEVPAAALASDQDYREFDMAVDICEDVQKLSAADVAKIMGILQRYGVNTKLSSIHINAWFGTYDKLTTTKRFIRQELGLDPDADNDKFVFVGDSPNDEPMFEFFNKSVGVSNVLNFRDKMKHNPKFVTKGKSGTGFSELASKILKA